jgi:hypothetical protein
LQIRIFGVIYDKTGKELLKKHFHRIDSKNESARFPSDLESIINGKTKWRKNEFLLINENGETLGKMFAENIVNQFKPLIINTERKKEKAIT